MTSTEKFYELTRRVHDGEATEEEYARLEEFLQQSPELRVTYLRYMNIGFALEGTVFKETAPVPLGCLETSTLGTSRLWWPVMSLLVGILLTAFLLPPFLAPPPVQNCVATLIAEEACEWDKGIKLQEGQRLAEGPLALKSGAAVLRFDGGALMFMRGQVSVELRSRSQAALHSGNVIVKAEDQAAGFLLDTPNSRVVDLGTEFAVNVGESGATEVHVLEGLVSYTQPSPSSSIVASDEVLLAAGQAVRFGSRDRQKVQSIALQAMRFEDACEGLYSQQVEPLIAHEPFAYSTDALALEDAQGGDGWRGSWEPAGLWPFPDDPMRPLRFLPSPAIVNGRLLDASNRFPQISRKLANPIRFDRDGVYYFSARVRWVPGSSSVQYMRQARVILRCSGNPKNLRYVLNMPVCLCPQVQRHDLEVFTSREKVTAGELQRWVLKIIARKDGMDELHFRVFGETESIDPVEPGQWHVSLTEERNDEAIDQIVLDTYLAPDTVAFGDIRLGATWRSVVSDLN